MPKLTFEDCGYNAHFVFKDAVLKPNLCVDGSGTSTGPKVSTASWTWKMTDLQGVTLSSCEGHDFGPHIAADRNMGLGPVKIGPDCNRSAIHFPIEVGDVVLTDMACFNFTSSGVPRFTTTRIAMYATDIHDMPQYQAFCVKLKLDGGNVTDT